MSDGQITGQRVEVRHRPPNRTNHSGTEFYDDFIYSGTVVAFVPSNDGRNVMVQTDDGAFVVCNANALSIEGSAKHEKRIERYAGEIAEYQHFADCGPLCPTHGDARDTSMHEPTPLALITAR